MNAHLQRGQLDLPSCRSSPRDRGRQGGGGRQCVRRRHGDRRHGQRRRARAGNGENARARLSGIGSGVLPGHSSAHIIVVVGAGPVKTRNTGGRAAVCVKNSSSGRLTCEQEPARRPGAGFSDETGGLCGRTRLSANAGQPIVRSRFAREPAAPVPARPSSAVAPHNLFG